MHTTYQTAGITPGHRQRGIQRALLTLGLVGLLALTAMAALANSAYNANNLPVSAATYLGGSGADQLNAVAVASDNVILAAGVFPAYNPVAPTELLGGGTGALLRMAADGQSVLSVTRVGASIDDMEVNTAGSIVVCGAFGVGVLNPTATTFVWSATDLGAITRCAIGSDGTVAALKGGKQVFVFNGSGEQVGKWNSGGASRHLRDVAVHGPSQTVIETGYDQKSSNLKVAFINGRAYTKAKKWTNYDFSASAVFGQNLGADSEGRRVAIGADGKLYFAGYVDGGNAIYTRDPRNIASRLGADRLIKFDRFNDPFNISGAKALAWYGRFNPANGVLERGQFLLTRLSDGKGNSIGIRAITADGQGVVYISGEAYASIENRDSRQVAGVTVGGYSGGEPFVLVVSPAMTKRMYWSPFAAPGKNGGGSPANGIAVGANTAVVGVTLKTDNASKGLVTVNALQGGLGGGASDAYVAVWPNNFVLPGGATLAAPPAGTEIAEYAPSFFFNAPNTDKFRLQIRRDGAMIFDKLYDASAICGQTWCQVNLQAEGAQLTNSPAYDWRIQMINPLGRVNSQRLAFSVNFPGKAYLNQPLSGATVSRTPTFSWGDTYGKANQFRVRVIRTSTGQVTLSPWLNKADVCVGVTCTYTLPDTLRLANGAHRWQILSRAAGLPNISRSDRLPFTVDKNLPLNAGE